MENKKKSAAIERRVQAYPPPKYHKLTEAYAKATGITQSEVVTTALKDFFDKMPECERSRIISVSKHSY
jgi:hypothetical protein